MVSVRGLRRRLRRLAVPHGSGPRVRLRGLQPGDLTALDHIHEDPHPDRYVHGDPWWGPAAPHDRIPLRLLQLHHRRVDRDGGLVWVVTARAGGGVLGWISLQRLPDGTRRTFQLRVRLARSVWGRGLWTEAGAVATALAFRRLRADVIYLLVRPDNPATARGAHHIGYKTTGTFTDDGQVYDKIELDAATWRSVRRRTTRPLSAAATAKTR